MGMGMESIRRLVVWIPSVSIKRKTNKKGKVLHRCSTNRIVRSAMSCIKYGRTSY